MSNSFLAIHSPKQLNASWAQRFPSWPRLFFDSSLIHSACSTASAAGNILLGPCQPALSLQICLLLGNLRAFLVYSCGIPLFHVGSIWLASWRFSPAAIHQYQGDFFQPCRAFLPASVFVHSRLGWFSGWRVVEQRTEYRRLCFLDRGTLLSSSAALNVHDKGVVFLPQPP
jgi:hypothetical protein